VELEYFYDDEVERNVKDIDQREKMGIRLWLDARLE
jgi:hypothetical protein